ncbi:hypothetical protein RYX36_028635 [Vicia faba]
MNREQKRGKVDKGSDGAEKVIVAVKASKEIPKTALVWSLTHVVQPGDCITLLVVVPSQNSGHFLLDSFVLLNFVYVCDPLRVTNDVTALVIGRKLWGFPRFAGDCANGHKKSATAGASSENKNDITDSCSQMILQLHDVYDPNKINVRIKIVSGSPCGAVAAEAKKVQAKWVVLDKHLKHEEKQCMEELQCNIAVMKGSQPKTLRLNLVGSQKKDLEETCQLPSEQHEMLGKQSDKKNGSSSSTLGVLTPTSSPEVETSFTATEAGTSSVSSSDHGTSPFCVSEIIAKSKKEETIEENQETDDTISDTDGEHLSASSASLRFQPWMSDLFLRKQSSQREEKRSESSRNMLQTFTTRALLEKFSRLDREAEIEISTSMSYLEFSGSVREAVALSRNAAPGPPPLCSICQHKAPVFGKPPRWFSYAELELATDGFSPTNFLAEGGFGSVHRGVLPEGQVIAVKQHKLASSQGDLEFCSEVEVLSCAQHRNVVMLIGFCIEDKRRLLVYEYICNGSLDTHLYGRQHKPLEWSARQKIAVGAARGLRYLHEECRVGCIIHRDMRPNNILITHDFEPLVGDFGLARWQPDGDTGVDTRVIGTFGYLAPEYAQSGQITEKADVYSFGVVLVELVTGRKAVDINRPKGQQCLTEWARPLLEEYAIEELIDPRLGSRYSEHEVSSMLHAASLCIRRDPYSRPRMSQVLRILEGDTVMESPRQFGGSPSL